MESFELELSGSTEGARYQLHDQSGQSLGEVSLEGLSGVITISHSEPFHAVVFLGSATSGVHSSFMVKPVASNGVAFSTTDESDDLQGDMAGLMSLPESEAPAAKNDDSFSDLELTENSPALSTSFAESDREPDGVMLFGDAAEPLSLADLLEDDTDEPLGDLLPDSGEEEMAAVTAVPEEEAGAAGFEGSVAGELLDMIQPAVSQTSES